MAAEMHGDAALQTRAEAIYNALVVHFGTPEFTPGGDPMEELIGTILSANTTDANSSKAFDRLMERFGGDWEAVRLAPLDEIKDAIRIAGMYNQKAPHIVATLEQVRAERGDYELDFLATLAVDEAMAFLTRLPGVGHKTASIVLLFTYNRGAFPVDTHIQRITQRLGLAGRKASAEKIKAIWESLLPPEVFYPLHINLIRHGRQICRARDPRCDVCPLQGYCDYFQRTGEWADA